MGTNTLLCIVLVGSALPRTLLAQAPSLGTAADFALFSSVGAVTNTGISHVTGHVGTNSGSSTGFGNVNGVMHDNDGASAQAFADVLSAYNQLNSTVATMFPAPLMGNGQVLTSGVYAINAPATLDHDLTLNAQGNADAVFIIKIQGAFSTYADAKVKLINGALACNVFWKVEGLVSMASGTMMKGTIIANNAAIHMNANDTLEGRALSTAGAVTLDGAMVYTPTGCGSPILTGPAPPPLGAMACYGLFSASGPVSNSGITYVNGDVGTNSGSTTGFNASHVNGSVHLIPDGSTAQCASDLAEAYTHLNTLDHDIVLLYPAQFGNDLVLTPHTYLLDAATVLTDTLYLDAMNNVNAVFVIKINGALTTSTYSRVVLRNGARSTHVFWKVEGAVNINNYSVFRGNLICNNGALGAINTGVTLDGRAFTTTGALTTTNITTTMACDLTSDVPDGSTMGGGTGISIFPNPFTSSFELLLDGNMPGPYWLRLFSVTGAEVKSTLIAQPLTTVGSSDLAPGIYSYQLTGMDGTVRSGKLVSEQ